MGVTGDNRSIPQVGRRRVFILPNIFTDSNQSTSNESAVGTVKIPNIRFVLSSSFLASLIINVLFLLFMLVSFSSRSVYNTVSVGRPQITPWSRGVFIFVLNSERIFIFVAVETFAKMNNFFGLLVLLCCHWGKWLASV